METQSSNLSGEYCGGWGYFLEPRVSHHLASAGLIDGMIHALDQILAHTDEQTKIVPGHGLLASRADLQDYRDMLVQV